MLLLLLVVAPLAAAFTIIIAVVRVSRLVVGAWTSVPVPLASLHELEALSILHRRSILDRLDVLFVVESHVGRVKS